MEETSSSLLLPRYLLKKHGRARRRRLLILASGLVTVALLVAGLLLWPGNRQPPLSPSSPGSAPGTQRAAPPGPNSGPLTPAPWVTFTIVVQPRTAKARLVLGGRTYHGTALRLRTPRSAEPTKLRVSAPGHRTKELLLVPSADARVRVKLERVGRRPRARSRRKTKKRPRAALLELTD